MQLGECFSVKWYFSMFLNMEAFIVELILCTSFVYPDDKTHCTVLDRNLCIVVISAMERLSSSLVLTHEGNICHKIKTAYKWTISGVTEWKLFVHIWLLLWNIIDCKDLQVCCVNLMGLLQKLKEYNISIMSYNYISYWLCPKLISTNPNSRKVQLMNDEWMLHY